MKAILKMMSVLLMVMSLFVLTGCASTSNNESTGQYIDSAATTAKVKSKLAQQLGMDTISAIQVSTYKGVVQLSGFVKTKQEIQKAVKIAKAVPGVQQVENSLLVKKDLK